jgi:hypothetical protein
MESQQFWPCELPFQPTASERRFLEAARQSGYHPFVSGVSDFGALADAERAGEIIVRGRTRRELVLSVARKTVFTAFVDDFEIAADALLQWLGGASVGTILEAIRDHLIVMPGMKSSCEIV